ncbi:hypothetical protein [Streptomyces bambusae]|nr:hypothetical protein [Streptomyces bambusae]
MSTPLPRRNPGRERQRQAVPGWVAEGTAISDPIEGRNGIVR